MIASPIGQLSTQVRILDDGDGLSSLGLDVLYEKSFGTLLEAGDALGGAVAQFAATGIDGQDEELAVVGAPNADGGLGAAYVYRREGGVWIQDARLEPPTTDLLAINATPGDISRA